ncbi:unnamed protein product [Bursaphelenchus okinawaensis]|uniref:Presequence protease, mitochondrial n=1 Tax=Bursaphelenchus okinawaensis TaxID=465554 RepID=A0A811LPL7_9BILA|nr:unnamed protein product [Bursaphelenchus okinawaensis]CAG9127221.1 unnamed protein product [Bursaphelenchus okinawaensis]
MASDNYKVVLKSHFAGKIPVTVYRSERTGLHVALAQTKGPTVSCQINFATETETDDGLPHTLEHLVFMGSKSFPFKGGLDLLSLNAMAVDGTNAFTAQDHTGYTVKTIGVQGMQQFIHIYCDHLLNPLLTPENYKTEVYHITPEGVDAGVVYSEMQEHENMLECIVHRQRLASVFPDNACFRVETGGRLKEIRELCSLERVRNYHQKYYHLKNMWIYLCGAVNPEEMFKSIDKIDAAPENAPPAEFVRPFSNCTIPDIKHKRTEPVVVKGPADQEDEGVVQIGFLGRAASESEWISAVQILSTYLTKTTSAPLQKEMVLTADPYCESVYMSLDMLPRCETTFDFSGVPVDKLDQIQERFFNVIRQNTTAETIDLERIRYIIERKIKKLYSKLESNVANTVFNGLTLFQLFSDSHDNKQHFEAVMNPIPILETLLTKPVTYWSEICQELFQDNCAVVIGKADEKMAAELNELEKTRLKDLTNNLDKYGCHILEKSGEDENKVPNLSAIERSKTLQKFDLFSVKSSLVLPKALEGGEVKVDWYKDASQKVAINELPFTAVVHDVDSSFVRTLFMFDLKQVPLKLRKYVMIFTDLLFSSPATVDGQQLTDKQVADLFTKEIMEKSCDMGFLQNYLHFFHLYLEMPADEFHLLPKWTQIILNNTIFEREKVLSIVKNLASGASSSKRDGFTMCQNIMHSLNNSKDHESRWHEDVVLEKFHRQLAKKLEKDNAEAQQIIDDLNELRNHILRAPLNAHLICDPRKLGAKAKLDKKSWEFLDFTEKNVAPVAKIQFDREEDGARFKTWAPGQKVIKVDSTDSSYFLQRVHCEHSYGSPEHVALLLWTNYLSMMEGVLWKEVRGNGFAYGANLYVSPDHQSMTMNLYRCSRIIEAYEASKKAVLKVFDEELIDSELYESAKRGCVSNTMSKYSSLKSTATLTAFNDMRGIKMEDIEALTHQIWDADMKESFQLAKPFIMKMFDEEHCLRAIACPSNKVEDVKKNFPKIETVTVADLQYTPE